jgi:putative phage-type endonuclease
MGVDQYRTALDIYQAKVGEREPDAPNAAMKRGTFLEPVARKLYSELTGRKVRQQPQRQHASYPWMIGNVDGQILGDERGPGILEIKCPSIWSFAKIEREGLPLSYVIQAMHYMEVFGYAWASFAIFSAELWRMIHVDVPRDDELASALVLQEQRFWMAHVEKRVPPPVQVNTAPDLMAALAKAEAAAGDAKLIVRNDPEWAEAARMYTEAREIVETGENLLETSKERLKALMVERGAVEGSGLRVYWSEQDGRVTFDRKALEASAPLDRIAVATAINQRVMNDDTKVAILADLGQCGVNLKTFEKQGKSFDVFKAYQVRIGVGD